MRLSFAMLVLTIVPFAAVPSRARADEFPTPGAIIDRALGKTFRVVQPAERKIDGSLGQSGFVESFERAAIHAPMAAYLETWNVDIGDRVKKGDVLAQLFIPCLLEELETKKALAKLEEQKVKLAFDIVKVAEADVQAAAAKVDQSKAILKQYQATVDRWDIQVKRIKQEVDNGVVDAMVFNETQRQLSSAAAEVEAGKAAIAKAEAELQSCKASRVRYEAAVEVARASVQVAKSQLAAQLAQVDLLTLRAPFDGIVTARNANTQDFVLPAASGKEARAPIYVVERVDKVRVFVDVPQPDVTSVKKGTKAKVRIKAVSDKQIPASVSRTAWMLNFPTGTKIELPNDLAGSLSFRTRTMRAQIELPNDDGKILPGMYAYAKIYFERDKVMSLPAKAVLWTAKPEPHEYCWFLVRGVARKVTVRTGLRNKDWVEVIDWRRDKENAEAEFDGSEKVLLVDEPPDVAEGDAVSVAKDAPASTRPVKGFSFKAETTRSGSSEKISLSATIAGPSLFRFSIESKNGSGSLVGGGDTFWLKSGKEVEELYAGKDRATFDALRALFYGLTLPDRLATLKGKEFKLTVLGEQPVDGADALVVRASHELLPLATLYFDQSTGRLVKSQFTNPASTYIFGSRPSKSLEIYYDDYKEVNGVRHYTRLKLRTDETLEFELRDLQFLDRVDPRDFRKPQ